MRLFWPRNMMSRRRVFNVFLFVAAAAFLTGCLSEESKRKREYSNIRIHVEADSSGGSGSAVSIHRAQPIMINIEREPIIDEHNVVAAALVEQAGGTFAIQIKLDRRGSWILERTTVTHHGRHLAISSMWGPERWLAAPYIIGKNSTGTLIFTPDATREESERIVRGLNNTAHKLERKENWPFPSGME